MAAPIPLRPNMTADDLRQQARRTRNASQARRLLALAEIYDGGLRTPVMLCWPEKIKPRRDEQTLVSSIDLAELNPFLDERGKTALLMVDLLASLMGRQVLDRPTQSFS